MSPTHEQTCKGARHEETTSLDEVGPRRQHRAASGAALGPWPTPSPRRAESRTRQAACTGCALNWSETQSDSRKSREQPPAFFNFIRSTTVLHPQREQSRQQREDRAITADQLRINFDRRARFRHVWPYRCPSVKTGGGGRGKTLQRLPPQRSGPAKVGLRMMLS